MAKPKHWIADAHIHHGALHRALGVPEGQTIPAKKLAAATKRGGKVAKMVALARTLGSFHH